MIIRKVHGAALGAFALMAISSAAALTIGPRAQGLSEARSLIPADQPVGILVEIPRFLDSGVGDETELHRCK
jgi:hypothetical protein